MAAVENLAVFAKAHESVACSALTVASRAERRDMVLFHKPANNLIKGSLVGNIKLLRIVGTLLLAIAADRCSRCAADLRNAVIKNLSSDCFALTGGNNHSGVGNGDTDTCDNLSKHIVGKAVVENIGVNIVRMLNSRNAYRVRTYAVNGFKMLSVHKKSRKFIFIALKTEENAETDIVNAALHGSVHCLGMVIVIMLRSLRMKLKIALFVVGFLEKNIRADARFLKLSVILDRCCGDIYIDTADITVLMVNRINCLNALKNVLNRIIDGIFARFNGKSLMTHILEGNNLVLDLLLSELLSCDMLVLIVIRAINAAVYAIVGKIKRSKHNDSVAVKGELYLVSELVHLLNLFRDIAGKKNGSLSVCKAGTGNAVVILLRASLFKQRIDKLNIVLIFFCIFDCCKDFFIIDEFLGFE